MKPAAGGDTAVPNSRRTVQLGDLRPLGDWRDPPRTAVEVDPPLIPGELPGDGYPHLACGPSRGADRDPRLAQGPHQARDDARRRACVEELNGQPKRLPSPAAPGEPAPAPSDGRPAGRW